MSKYPSFVPTYHHDTYPAIGPAAAANSVEGKVVIITGGGKGIGRATAFSFAKAHARAIVTLGRTEKTLKETSEALQSFSNVKVEYSVSDATDYVRINKIFQSVKDRFGAVDVVVDNKGYLPDLTPLRTASIDEWFKAFEINVKGSFVVTQAFINNASPGATFISTNSGAVNLYVPNHTSYAASKLALIRVIEDAQVEHPEFRFFSIHPGGIETDMNTKSGFGKHDEESLPADFSVWLVNPEADFLKGRMFSVNWDIGEMKAKSREILENDLLKVGVRGYPAS